ncbi:MAG TPA: MBL fold metallo-hydrolase [Casimicrobiaceae bacterium]|jgi:glyoxylase-like metal-dependent hydrolase (beta-lactamase superfamily II)
MIALPPEVHVFVRDWLSANHVLLKGRDEAVVVDTGYAKHIPLTRALLASRTGLDGRPLARIVNTHCHSDHVGGNAALQRDYACPIAIPEGEARHVAAWDERALLIGYAGQRAERFTATEIIRAGSVHVWGDLEWRALAAPGHDMGALVFFNDAHGILISGDALWRNGYGFVMPAAFDAAALPATRATLEMLATLGARCVIPGHGEPFTDVDDAIERALRRTAAFEADPLRLVWHAVKVMLVFSLLDRERMPASAIAGWVEHTGIIRDFNAQYLGLAPGALAERLAIELVKTGALRRDGSDLVPA